MKSIPEIQHTKAVQQRWLRLHLLLATKLGRIRVNKQFYFEGMKRSSRALRLVIMRV